MKTITKDFEMTYVQDQSTPINRRETTVDRTMREIYQADPSELSMLDMLRWAERTAIWCLCTFDENHKTGLEKKFGRRFKAKLDLIYSFGEGLRGEWYRKISYGRCSLQAMLDNPIEKLEKELVKDLKAIKIARLTLLKFMKETGYFNKKELDNQ